MERHDQQHDGHTGDDDSRDDCDASRVGRKFLAKQIESGQASTVVHIGQTAFLGVQTRPNTSGGSGALVTGVVSGSPAEGGGLSRGDLITSLDGKTVESATSLTSILDGHHPPDRVALGWTDANGQSHTATVTLAAGPVG